IRYPFDSSFPPNPVTPGNFVADGNAQPPGGPNFTVEGTLYAAADVVLAFPVSNTIMVNITQGVWSMGPFIGMGGMGGMPPGNYLFRVILKQMAVQLDTHVITINIM